MVYSTATDVAAYLAGLPEPRRARIERARAFVQRHLPAGYEETMGYGMIGWVVPLARYPDTYNGQPLTYVALAAQKRHDALYLMGLLGDPDTERRLREGYAQRGLRLDLGRCCLRFSERHPLAEDLIGPLIASMPPAAFIAQYEAARRSAAAGRGGRAS